MLIELEVNNDHDIELILNLARRLRIPYRQTTAATEKKSVDQTERIQRILMFRQSKPSSFGDASEWQRKERKDRDMPFSDNQ